MSTLTELLCCLPVLALWFGPALLVAGLALWARLSAHPVEPRRLMPRHPLPG